MFVLQYLTRKTQKGETVVLSFAMINSIARLRFFIHFKATKMKKVQNIFMMSQMLTNVKEITLVTWMLPTRTATDRTFVLVSPNVLEMDAIVQVFNVLHLWTITFERKVIPYVPKVYTYHIILFQIEKETHVGLLVWQTTTQFQMPEWQQAVCFFWVMIFMLHTSADWMKPGDEEGGVLRLNLIEPTTFK